MSIRKVKIGDYAIVDKKTGEVIAEEAMFLGNNAFVDKGFRKIFVAFLKDVVMNKEISGKAIRLLLWIIENLTPNSSEIYLHWENVCNELGITQGTYYNWLKILIKKGLLKETNRPKIYELVPYSAINGQTTIALRKKIKKEKRIQQRYLELANERETA